MKTIMFFGALLFGLVTIQSDANARELRKNETYCLESDDGGNSSGGSNIMWCQYETMAQCRASKTSPHDICSLNPVLAFERRRGR